MEENKDPYVLTVHGEYEINAILNAKKLAHVIWDLDQYLRAMVKYQEDKDWDDAEKIREKLYELMNEAKAGFEL